MDREDKGSEERPLNLDAAAALPGNSQEAPGGVQHACQCFCLQKRKTLEKLQRAGGRDGSEVESVFISQKNLSFVPSAR